MSNPILANKLKELDILIQDLGTSPESQSSKYDAIRIRFIRSITEVQQETAKEIANFIGTLTKPPINDRRRGPGLDTLMGQIEIVSKNIGYNYAIQELPALILSQYSNT